MINNNQILLSVEESKQYLQYKKDMENIKKIKSEHRYLIIDNTYLRAKNKKLKENIEIPKMLLQIKEVVNLERYVDILNNSKNYKKDYIEVVEYLLDKEIKRLRGDINSNSLHIKAIQALKKPFEVRESYYKQLFKNIFSWKR